VICMNEFINNIIINLHHFNLAELKMVFSSPQDILLILSLVIMEVILSVDNALVLAIMVKNLPKKQQKLALTLGIGGAYIFRLIAIVLGVYLVKIAWIKLVASLYLAYIVFNFFRSKDENNDNVNDALQKGLLATIISVELADIAFSIDSVVAAFGVSDIPWVILIGGMVGILCMREVTQVFVKLIEKVPELNYTAHILIGIVALKMFVGVFGIEAPDWLFLSTLFTTFIGTFVVHKFRKPLIGAK